MMAIRLCKTALVAAIALFFTLIAYGNVADYGSNWQFVQHVLVMDTIFPGSALQARAITSPALQELAYRLIIATEAITALLLWFGTARLALALRTAHFAHADFARAKGPAALGLTLGLLLYITGFITIGGEWFAMWQSKIWNGQQPSFGFITMTGLVLVILLLPEK